MPPERPPAALTALSVSTETTTTKSGEHDTRCQHEELGGVMLNSFGHLLNEFGRVKVSHYAHKVG